MPVRLPRCRLQDTGRTSTWTVTRRVKATSSGLQVPATPVLIATLTDASAEDITGKLRHARPGTQIDLGLVIVTQDRSDIHPGDILSGSHLGQTRELVVDTVERYQLTQQISASAPVKG